MELGSWKPSSCTCADCIAKRNNDPTIVAWNHGQCGWLVEGHYWSFAFRWNWRMGARSGFGSFLIANWQSPKLHFHRLGVGLYAPIWR